MLVQVDPDALNQTLNGKLIDNQLINNTSISHIIDLYSFMYSD